MFPRRMPSKWSRPSLGDKYKKAFRDAGDLTFNAKDRRCRIRGGPIIRGGYSEIVPCNAVIVDGAATGLNISDHNGSLFTFKGGTLCLLGRKRNVVECGPPRRGR